MSQKTVSTYTHTKQKNKKKINTIEPCQADTPGKGQI